MTAGVDALLAALAVALIGGAIWQRNNGRMRNTVPAPGHAARQVLAGQVPARQATGGAAAPAMRLDAAGTATPAEAPASLEALVPPEALAPPGAVDAGLRLTDGNVGQPLGERATLLQFSSAFCAPCRATRRILADVAGMTDGVAHVEVDAESRLDLVRQLNVLRTPTVLVLAADGTIVRRASGQPRKPDVIAAIGAAVDYNSHIYDRDRR
jgi:thiol-disulfide isomerase/thioredoxin